MELVDSDKDDFQDPINDEVEGAKNDDRQSDQRTDDLDEDENFDSEDMEEEELESNMVTELGLKSPYTIGEELEILQWDTHVNEEQRRLLQRNFRMREPQNFQDQLSNESGPTLTGMIMKCDQLEQEMANMSR
jgi:hypothetical protein